MIRIILPQKKKLSTPFISLVLILLLTGCSHLLHLDRAQDALNKGAELENASLFSTQPTDDKAPKTDTYITQSPESYYSLAYAEAATAMKGLNTKAKLRKVQILGNAYAVQSIAAWKLRRYKDAKSHANSALDEMENDNPGFTQKGAVYSRDYAMMKAMDLLINIQQTNDRLSTTLSKDSDASAQQALIDYKQLINNPEGKSGLIQSALSGLDGIIASVEDENLQTYFTLSQMAALKVWLDASSNTKDILRNRGAFESGTEGRIFMDNQDVVFVQAKKDYYENLKNRLEGGIKHPVYKWWKSILP